MRCKQSIAKVLSFVMMIVLTQKIAGGLYLHSWLHESKQLLSFSHNNNTVGPANCSCIDDFYASFIEPVILSAEPLLAAPADFSPVGEFVLPAIEKYFRSLRAPPASVSFFS